MTTVFRKGRLALALSLAVLAVCVPPLRVAVLDWIVSADLVPGTTLAGRLEGLPADSPAKAPHSRIHVQIGR